MQAIEKEQNKYIRNTLGFSCGMLKEMKQKPTLRQLYILREIIKISKWEKMNTFTSKDKKFVWINYNILFSSLKWMELSRQTLSKDITSLIQIDFLDIYEDNTTGASKMYFHVTEKTASLNIWE